MISQNSPVALNSITDALEKSIAKNAKKFARQVKRSMVARKKIVNFMTRKLASALTQRLRQKQASKPKIVRNRSLLVIFKHYFDLPSIKVKRTRKTVKRTVNIE